MEEQKKSPGPSVQVKVNKKVVLDTSEEAHVEVQKEEQK